MNNKFDELTKSMAQSVTRRGALKKFGLGIAGMTLACFGLTNRAEAGKSKGGYCEVDGLSPGNFFLTGYCRSCQGSRGLSPKCVAGTPASIDRVCGQFAALSSIHCNV